MFTGIVQGTAEVVEILSKENFRTHVLRMPAAQLEGLAPGASVAHNGCCLTVTRVEGDRVSFDLIQVAIGQAVIVQQVAVGLLHRQIHALEVTVKLAVAGFVGTLNNAKMDVLRVGRFHANEIE